MEYVKPHESFNEQKRALAMSFFVTGLFIGGFVSDWVENCPEIFLSKTILTLPTQIPIKVKNRNQATNLIKVMATNPATIHKQTIPRNEQIKHFL